MHPDWLIPRWPAPPGVRAVCTTRAGGRSAAPFDSLNLGDHVGDDALSVGANRAVLAQAIQAHPVFLRQVHGRGVVELDAGTPHGVEADACYTRERGLACTIMVADCLPLLLTDTRGSFVASAHAGWRGLAGQDGVGVIESLWARLGESSRERAAQTLAWLGPCIGPRAFEVGHEVRAAFLAHDPHAVDCFQSIPRTDKWLADLPALARRRLQALGIKRIHGNDGNRFWCTVSNPSLFFSHRRDRVSGRLAACVWRV